MMSAAGGDGGSGRQSRVPKDMKDLLMLCAEAADPQAPAENTRFEPMSEERKEWLQEALDSMTVSPVEEMKKAIGILDNPESDTEESTEALQTLIDWCEHIDFAIDFHKIGGFKILTKCLQSSEAEIRWLSLELVAALSQNNPYCQTAVLQLGIFPDILVLLDTDPDPTVKTKALYAVSCLTRDCQDALDMFISHDGFSIIMRAMQTDIEKVKVKSAFMLSAICTDNNKCKDILCDMGMIVQLVGHLSEEHTNFHEHLLSALLTIVKDHPRSVQECLRPELNLISVLQQKVNELKDAQPFREEQEYASQLLDILQLSQDSAPDNDVPR